MDKKGAAKLGLADLLEEFARVFQNEGVTDSSEATARTWVERFLQIFGWDTGDPREVAQEYRIRGRAARRLKAEDIMHHRPDYCLLSHGQRILYIDAKKFSADINKKDFIAYQVRCYGWSEEMKVSYAFNFNELAIYDCRFIPSDRDEADVARLRYLSQAEYLKNFDLLWEYFSKSAIDGGSLSRLHPDDERPKGSKTMDEDFEEKLSYWRKELARSIIRHEKVRDPNLLSAASQRILDRIVFLRICEDMGLEEWGALKSMANDEDGFWPLFLEEHEKRYGTVYDGILFPAKEEDDPSGVDLHLRSWWLKGKIFKEIASGLCYPQPYRFDSIPIDLLGGIYERYLGKRLRVTGSRVEDEYKPEYQRTKGAIYTPKWVVRRIVEKTLAPLVEGKSPEDILCLRIVDPSCGSAGFLMSAYEYLEEAILSWFHRHRADRRRSKFIREFDGIPYLHPDIVREIINTCLYGVDIDPEAVEVARMSLALRYLERTAFFEEDPQLLLKGIGLNIRQGNSLVGPDIVGLGINAENILKEVMPFDWRNEKIGFGKVMANGGFDAVVGNPPYIEVKRYKEWMPSQYTYLKESGVYETTAQGKTDVAMPFMEQGLRILKENGRLGYIIQNRFFKTDYGEAVRAWLRKNKAIEQIEDFRDLQIFEGRTTYTTIVILRRNSPAIHYWTYNTIKDAGAGKSSVSYKLTWDIIDNGVWSFDQPDLLEVHRELARKHGTIGQRPQFQVSVGLQTLYGKFYRFEPIEVNPKTIVGKNGMGEHATLERSALRPLCCNRGFYPFRKNNADAWVIFPYDIKDGRPFEIEWREFKKRFHKTATYLEEKKKDIHKVVEMEKGANRWHLYTYPKNLVSQTGPKALFPMTIEDTMATVDSVGDIYQDNVNVNSIAFPGASEEQLLAIAAVFNSTTFNALARLKAGLNDSGWRKFNKQYADLVPFPRSVTEDPGVVDQLSKLGRKIADLQVSALETEDEGSRGGARATLESLWKKLDSAVDDVYELTLKQKKIIRRYPRRVNRFDLLTRQQPVTDDDE